MHYANGRKAEIGDVVKGKGYNIKHEIIGFLLTANPVASGCNCTVACVTKPFTLKNTNLMSTLVFEATMLQDGKIIPSISAAYHIPATIEYGQLDAFVALDPATGEILLPEPDGAVDVAKAGGPEPMSDTTTGSIPTTDAIHLNT